MALPDGAVMTASRAISSGSYGFSYWIPTSADISITSYWLVLASEEIFSTGSVFA